MPTYDSPRQQEDDDVHHMLGLRRRPIGLDWGTVT